jgi:hypothetical protein
MERDQGIFRHKGIFLVCESPLIPLARCFAVPAAEMRNKLLKRRERASCVVVVGEGIEDKKGMTLGCAGVRLAQGQPQQAQARRSANKQLSKESGPEEVMIMGEWSCKDKPSSESGPVKIPQQHFYHPQILTQQWT